MRTRLMPVGELSDRDRGAWDDLADRALEPNPFFESHFALTAERHLGEGGVRLLVAENGGGWMACLPVRSRRWRQLPVPALGSWCHTHCFLGTPLVAGDRPEAALGGLLDYGRAKESVGLLVLDSLGQGGPVGNALGAAFTERRITPQVHRSHERATLHRRADGDYHGGMRTHHRRELRRQRRRLEQELGAPLETIDRAGEPAAVERFLRLEAAGWKGRQGTAFASSAARAELFRELCASFSERGRLQLLALECGGCTLAMKCNFLAADAIFCFKIAFDESLAKFSPGVQLELANVEIFEDTPANWMDSCADPDNEMINRLWPDRRRIETLLVPAGGALGRISVQGVRALRALRERERRSALASY